ncbi:hypothetical protein ABIB51_003275 [Arthrobacter sp. UYCu712]
MSYSFQVTFDCHSIEVMTRFWAVALRYNLEEPPAGYPGRAEFAAAQDIPDELWRGAVVDPSGNGPRLFFQPVPEGKVANNRVHLDIHASEGPGSKEDGRRRALAHADICVEAGATLSRVFDGDDGWHVALLDPEGNEFCIQWLQPREAAAPTRAVRLRLRAYPSPRAVRHGRLHDCGPRLAGRRAGPRRPRVHGQGKSQRQRDFRHGAQR